MARRSPDLPSKVQLYVLGLLARFGRQHGYRLKQRVSDEVADFARIELANIYYHLGRMEAGGLVEASQEREGRRPERAAYCITKAGERALDAMLLQALDGGYRAEFPVDAVLFFIDRLAAPGQKLEAALAQQQAQLDRVLGFLREHRQEVLGHVPQRGRFSVQALFRHHELHYEAELAWIRETRQALQGAIRSRRKGKKG